MKIKTIYGGLVDFSAYQEHTIKNIFKVLPLREEGKDWEKYLKGLLIELNGFDSLFEEAYFTALLAKLAGLLLIPDDEMPLFRKTVFDSIDILKKINLSEEQVG
jgi:hypothetical protein